MSANLPQPCFEVDLNFCLKFGVAGNLNLSSVAGRLVSATVTGFAKPPVLVHWFSTSGPQQVSRVSHGRLRTLKMGLHAE